MSGTWSISGYNDIKPRKRLPFEVRVDTSGIVPFASYTFRDDACLYKKGKDCWASAYYDYQLLLPDEKLYPQLNKTLCRTYYESDSLPQLRRKMKNASLKYFKEFRSDIASFFVNDKGKMLSAHEKDSVVSRGPCGLGCHVSNSYWTTVEYNSDKLFSFTFSNDDYGGGYGHCCLVNQYYSYSLLDDTVVHLKDIFDQKDSLVLKRSLLIGLGKAGLSQYVSNDYRKLVIPDSYYFTPTGVNFIFKGLGFYWAFTPVFIPFSEFGEKIKKQSWME
jgi:hypothetical protein